jgi:hypothetical protein
MLEPERAKRRLNMTTENYVPLVIDRPQAACAFLHPADWRVREITEDSGTEIFIAGPRNCAGTYTTALTVRVSRAVEQTPENTIADLLSRYRTLSGFKELGRASGLVAGYPAVEVEFSYTMPLPLNNVNPQWTMIQQRHVACRAGDRLWELGYAAPAEDYQTSLDAFRTLVQTFAPTGESASQMSYHPVITAAPQYVREGEVQSGPDKGGSGGESERHDG